MSDTPGVLLQVSDPHFGTEQPPVVEALVRMAHKHRPQVLVLSGDITQRARTAQFRAARKFVERLGIAHRVVIPGNHDIPLFNLPQRMLAPYANHRRAFGEELEPVYESGAWLVVGVNTTRPRRHKDGEVSPEQVERVAQRLRGARAGQLRVVVVHQPAAVLRTQDEHDRLHGHDHAIAAWASAGADMVMGGHIHLPYVLPLHELNGGLQRRLWAVQAGTALSHRVREGVANSVNIVRWDGAQAVVERWDYVISAGEFERVVETAVETGWVE
jgi:3',5'-cyclic AMP phosphodiesterase CpdA